MLRITAFLAGAFLVFALSLSGTTANAQERWAAVASDDDSESPVVWADSKEEANRRALAACRKISKTCGDRAGSTNVMSHTFTVMCCNKPRHGCSAGVEETREASLAMVQKVFDDAGFSSCKVIKRMSAKTGKIVN